ncbi:hypothetical protein L3C95_29440 [Chitinophaga filiformis]|uniref:hypothetical protein n=1 Tax=Chitinophaga filiformis TaxID=104663 RepID=UPI001F236F5E|nr:hypothetical protein [Chitinophaga filiformis]MCF6407057.1 hypothetical protein [Chitinophaga filiformis]
MNKKTIISLRAVFLLFVFFLNTGIGFACAVQSDLWSDGHHDMHDTHAMHHEHKKAPHKCCGDDMVKFEQLDKSQSQLDESAPLPLQACLYPVLYLPAIYQGYYGIRHKYIVPQQNPPPVDIRVSIQSFQI